MSAAPPSPPRLPLSRVEVPDPGVELWEIATGGRAPAAPFRAARFSVDPACETSTDRHAVHELWLIGGGRAELEYDGQCWPVGRGDVLYFAPGKPHRTRNIGEEPLVVFSVWWA